MRTSSFLATVVAVAAISLGTRADAAFMFYNANNQAGWFAPHSGDILSLKLYNWEPGIATALADGNLFGVGVVTQITDLSSGFTVWAPGNTQQLTFTFNNFAFNGLNVAAGANTYDWGNAASPGNVTVYFSDPSAGATIVSQGIAAHPETGATNGTPDPSGLFTQGSVVLREVGDANALNIATTALGAPANPGSTIQSNITALNNGQGFGYQDVVPGSGVLAGLFNGNGQLGGSDLYLQTNLQSIPGALPNQMQVFSSDPQTTNAVPEPVSLVTWCGLLAGLGFVRRKRKLA